MRKFGLALSFLASLGLSLWAWAPVPTHAQGVGPTNQIVCNKVATLTAGPVVITQVIAAVAGQSVNLCGWHVTNTGATGNFSLSYGTGSNCGTGTTVVIPAMNVTSTAPSADHAQLAYFTTPAANALCITPSVATISAVIFYAQF